LEILKRRKVQRSARRLLNRPLRNIALPLMVDWIIGLAAAYRGGETLQ
jgi:hypothetical protein